MVTKATETTATEVTLTQEEMDKALVAAKRLKAAKYYATLATAIVVQIGAGILGAAILLKVRDRQAQRALNDSSTAS